VINIDQRIRGVLAPVVTAERRRKKGKLRSGEWGRKLKEEGGRARRASQKAELRIKNRVEEKDFERRGNLGASGHGCPAN